MPESLVEGTQEWCQSSQLAYYNDFRKAAKFTDTVVVVEGRKFPVHSQLLSASSEYFEHIAFRDFPVAPEIDLADVTSASTFELLLNFVYSGSLPITGKNFTELYRVSSFLLMSQALDACRKWLLSQLDVVSSPSKKRLQLAVSIVLSHGDEEILDPIFTVLATDLEKYQDIISILGSEKFHELVRRKNVFLIDGNQLLMGVPYLTKLREIAIALFPAENANFKVEDLKSRLTTSPSALFISDQRYGSYPPHEETYIHYSSERFVTCHDFPPDEWTISGLTTYELDDWGGSKGLIAGVDVEYRNIWSGELRQFLCNLNTTHGMQYPIRKLELGMGETINSIRFNSGWLIDRIDFTTNRERVLSCGSSSGGGLRQVTRDASFQRYDDPSYSSHGWGDWRQPALALHGFAYTLISTLGKIAWVDVQFIFSGLNETAAQLIDSSKVKLSI
ncbi:hypothetical protein SprV_0100390800 [Sparganum proliferum]